MNRPKFSTLSDSTSMVYGADWPKWQRELCPVTYERNPEIVRQKLAECVAALASERAFMFEAMRNGWGKSSVRNIRRRVDTWARYVRNCETQLGLIESTRAYLAAKMEMAA